MASAVSPDFRVFADAESLATAAAELLSISMRSAMHKKNTYALALAGGNTPRLLYEKLGRAPYDQLPWQEVSLCWGDERFVPADDKQSNFRMAKETLLSALPTGPKSIVRVNTDLPSASHAAIDYGNKLRELFAHDSLKNGWPVFDCILLGIGADGHTASLFPGDQAVLERKRWATVGIAPNGSRRISLTLPVLNAACLVIFLVSGADKAETVAKIAAGTDDHFPAAMVKAEQVIWLCDADAAAQLPCAGQCV